MDEKEVLNEELLDEISGGGIIGMNGYKRHQMIFGTVIPLLNQLAADFAEPQRTLLLDYINTLRGGNQEAIREKAKAVKALLPSIQDGNAKRNLTACVVIVSGLY